MELIALLSSAVSTAKILSKLFLPPEAIDSKIDMEYIAEQGYIEYKADFCIPRLRRWSFRRKQIPSVKLECAEGFLIINAYLKTETDSRELVIPTLHCSLPPLTGKKEVSSLAGAEVSLRVQISIDLTHRILCNWVTLEPDCNNHLKATLTNTMDIRVRNFLLRKKLPANRKLKKAVLHINKKPHNAPFILQHKIEIDSCSGDLKKEFPSVDTSTSTRINVQEDSTKYWEIIIPIELLEKKQELIVDLVFQ